MTERVAALLQTIGHHPNAQPGQLTLPELGALIVVAGIEHGFEVELEVPCCAEHQNHKVDCLWRARSGEGSRGAVVVAWEFDGRDARPAHLLGGRARRGNLMKLGDTGAPVKVQALYSVRNGVLKDRRSAVRPALEGAGIAVYLDSELISDKLEAIVSRAITRR